MTFKIWYQKYFYPEKKNVWIDSLARNICVHFLVCLFDQNSRPLRILNSTQCCIQLALYLLSPYLLILYKGSKIIIDVHKVFCVKIIYLFQSYMSLSKSDFTNIFIIKEPQYCQRFLWCICSWQFLMISPFCVQLNGKA